MSHRAYLLVVLWDVLGSIKGTSKFRTTWMIRSVQSYLCDEKSLAPSCLIPFPRHKEKLILYWYDKRNYTATGRKRFLDTQAIPREIHEISNKSYSDALIEPRTFGLSRSYIEKSCGKVQAKIHYKNIFVFGKGVSWTRVNLWKFAKFWFGLWI